MMEILENKTSAIRIRFIESMDGQIEDALHDLQDVQRHQATTEALFIIIAQAFYVQFSSWGQSKCLRIELKFSMAQKT